MIEAGDLAYKTCITCRSNVARSIASSNRARTVATLSIRCNSARVGSIADANSLTATSPPSQARGPVPHTRTYTRGCLEFRGDSAAQITWSPRQVAEGAVRILTVEVD